MSVEKIRWRVAAIAIALILCVTGLVAQNHAASTWAIIGMGASVSLAVALVIIRGYSAFFSALVLFLFLGFWLKFSFVSLTGSGYIEPIGFFDMSSGQWDDALLVVSAAFLGVSASMIADQTMGPLQAKQAAIAKSETYIRVEKPLAFASIAVALICFGANWYFGFVKIGLDHSVIVPRPVFIAISFIVLWGAALWLACMGYWAWCGRRLSMTALLVLGLMQGLLAGISNASRARYVFHALAFGFGWLGAYAVDSRRSRLGLFRFVGLVALAAVLMAASLVAVSADRVIMYNAGAAISDLPSRDQTIGGSPQAVSGDVSADPVVDANEMVRQVRQLFIGRWIGIEGVMAVVGYDNKGFQLLIDGITESPDVGNDGIFERISDSPYVKLPGVTFLTTAGSVAILYYSGSIVIVFLGMFLLGMIGAMLERGALWLTESPFASAVVAVCFANFICQVNQWYTPFIFTIMMMTACVGIFVFRIAVVSWDARVASSNKPKPEPVR